MVPRDRRAARGCADTSDRQLSYLQKGGRRGDTACVIPVKLPAGGCLRRSDLPRRCPHRGLCRLDAPDELSSSRDRGGVRLPAPSPNIRGHPPGARRHALRKGPPHASNLADLAVWDEPPSSARTCGHMVKLRSLWYLGVFWAPAQFSLRSASAAASRRRASSRRSAVSRVRCSHPPASPLRDC